MSANIDWTPAESNPGNGRGDPRPQQDILNAEHSHQLNYRGAAKESSVTLPPGANVHFAMATPYFPPHVKAHLLQFENGFNYSLNHLRPTHFNQHISPVLTASPYNSCCCVWKGDGKKEVEYAQGQGILRTKPGTTVLYEGEFDLGYRHGYGSATLFDATFKDCFYTGQWKWGSRDGWGKVILTSDATVVEGFWKNDALNGINRETAVDGSVYTGLYRDGRREGCGRFVFPGGQVEDHYYYQGRLLSKVVYSGREVVVAASSTAPTETGEVAAAATNAAGSPPQLAFIDAFLQAKARQPVREGVATSPDSSSSSSGAPDSSVDALTGPLKLGDKILTREVDEKLVADASKDITKALGTEVKVTIDWDSVTKSEGPRKIAYTIHYGGSAYVLKPLAAAISNLAKDEMTKESLVDKTKTVLVRQSASPLAAVYEKEQLIISSNFEFGRASEIIPQDLAKLIEKVL